MKRVLVVICFLIIFATPALAAKSISNRITNAKVIEKSDQTKVLFNLSAPVVIGQEEFEVKTKGDLFWVEIPNTYEKHKKRIFYKWKSDKIEGIGLRRATGKVVHARVLFKDGEKPVDPSWVKAFIEKGKLVFLFPNTKPAPPVAKSMDDSNQGEEKTETTPSDTPPINLDDIFKVDNPENPALSEANGQAEEGADAGILSDNSNKTLSLGLTAVKFGSALLIVIGIILGMTWVAKRFNLPQRLSGSEVNVVKVVGTTMVGLKKQVSVIDVAGQYFVIGVGQSSMTMLGKVDDPNAIARLSNEESNSISTLENSQKTEIAETPFTLNSQEKNNVAPNIDGNVGLNLSQTGERGAINSGSLVPPDLTISSDSARGPDQFRELLNNRQKSAANDYEPGKNMAAISSIREKMQKLKRL